MHHRDQPRPDADQTPLDVGDPVLGKSRLLARQCNTCVFRPGNAMDLVPGRLRNLVEQARAAGSYIVCHETLPHAVTSPGVEPVICRGFHDRYSTTALQLIQRLWGFVEVPPPGTDNPTPQPQSTAGCEPATTTPQAADRHGGGAEG